MRGSTAEGKTRRRGNRRLHLFETPTFPCVSRFQAASRNPERSLGSLGSGPASAGHTGQTTFRKHRRTETHLVLIWPSGSHVRAILRSGAQSPNPRTGHASPSRSRKVCAPPEVFWVSVPRCAIYACMVPSDMHANIGTCGRAAPTDGALSAAAGIRREHSGQTADSVGP